MSVLQSRPIYSKRVPAGYVLCECIACGFGLVLPASQRDLKLCPECNQVRHLIDRPDLSDADYRQRLRDLNPDALTTAIAAGDYLNDERLLTAAADETLYRLDVLCQRQTDEQQDREQQQEEAELEDGERWDGMS